MMGWWGHDIMGGDTPLDVKDRFEDELAGKYTPEAAADFIQQLHSEWGCEGSIIAQSVGWLVMHHGLPMSEELRTLVVDGCNDDPSSDWIEKDQRIQAVSEFKALVQSYPPEGQPTKLKRSSLFGELFKKLNK